MKWMKWKTVTLAAVVSLLTARSVQAVDWSRIFSFNWSAPACNQPTCCNDYCAKPMPRLSQITCFACDDYVSKREPCIPNPGGINRGGFVCDDYTPKCPPELKCAPCDDLKCVPANHALQ